MTQGCAALPPGLPNDARSGLRNRAGASLRLCPSHRRHPSPLTTHYSPILYSTSTTVFPVSELFFVSVTVIVWFSFFFSTRPVKVCTPSSPAVNV